MQTIVNDGGKNRILLGNPLSAAFFFFPTLNFAGEFMPYLRVLVGLSIRVGWRLCSEA